MDAMPFLKYVCNPLKAAADEYNESFDQLVEVVLKEAVASESEGYNEGIATLLRKAMEKSEITYENFKYLLGDLIFAGTITTTNTLYSFLNILIHHPEVQHKLQHESDDVIGERHVTLADRAKMPYHMATLQEMLRYTTVAPLGVVHSTTQDTTVNGKAVPAKTNIYFNHFGLNHNEKNFPEPYAFRPERFSGR